MKTKQRTGEYERINIQKEYFYKTVFLAAMIAAIFVVPYGAGAQSGPLSSPGAIEGTGTHFEIANSRYLDAVVESSEPIALKMNSAPRMITIMIEPVSLAASTRIIVSGFAPLTVYYKYEDDYRHLEEFTTDGNGAYAYTQNIAKPHFVFIQPIKSTKFIRDNSTGGDCFLIGNWNITTKTCALTRDVFETIQIDSNNITLDGNGHSITGSNTGFGVYLSGKTGVTVRNLVVQRFSYGIFLTSSHNNALTGNSFLRNGNTGIFLSQSNNNTLTANISRLNYEGFFLSDSSSNRLSGNALSENRFNFNLVGASDADFDNSVDTSNTVDGKPIYYVKNAANQTYDSSTNAGVFYCLFCTNIVVKDLTLAKNFYGALFWKTHDSRIENTAVEQNQYGISLLHADNNTIHNNILSSNGSFAIYLNDSNNNALTHNTISHTNNDGVVILYSSNNLVSDNSIDAIPSTAIALVSGSGGSLVRNVFSQSGGGIVVTDFSGLLIENNTLDALENYGIVFYRTVDTAIKGNTITNSGVGVSLNGDSNNNTIFRNNFIDNLEQVFIEESIGNLFYSNYWSDFDVPPEGCRDSNGDNMCDVPYVFSGGQDSFPWVLQSGWIAPQNQPPTISFSQEEGYALDPGGPGVNPNKGAASSTIFTLKAVYADADNNPPSYMRAVVDGASYAMSRDEATTTSELLRDGDYTNGEQYVVSGTSPKGVHAYFFEASDGNDTARLPASSALTFEAGYSNVAFLPGLEASRLYWTDPNCRYINCENQLWEPNRNDDVRKLYLNPDGTLKNIGIYTRDIIDEAFGFNVYKNFISSMNKLVSTGVIAAWQALPYDWRRDQINIANEDILLEEGKVYRMIEEVEKLAQTSQTGKVTLITHSNGGLVGKALILKLRERGEVNIIDKVIMVAAPQLGTPEALTGLLHGGQRGFFKGWLPSYETLRELGENMQSAYGLAPSRAYFNAVDTDVQPIIEFSTTMATQYLRSIYGNAITGFDALRRFLTGEEGARIEPLPQNVDEPNVLRPQFLDRAQADHAILDSWTPPAGVEFIQIAGWGLDTLRGIRYEGQKKKSCTADLSVCSTTETLDPQPLFTEDGDKTVVVPSAMAMEGQKFYLNLPKHNQELFLGRRRNREHSDILEADELQALIKDIIQDDGILSSHKNITSTQPPPNDANKKLRIRVHSPVSLDLYDAGGNHTGAIQNPNADSDIRLFEEEIPNSYYLEMGEGKYAGSDTSTTTSVVLRGQSLGTFTLEIDEVSGTTTTGTLHFNNIPVTASSTITIDIQTIASATPLQIDLNSDGVVDFALSSSASVDSDASLEILASIIQNMDIKHPFKKELVKDIKKIQKYLKKEAEHGGGDEENNHEVNEGFLHFEKDVRKFVKKNILSRDDGEKLLQIIGTIKEGVIK